MAGEGKEASGVRAGSSAYYVSGTPTATPAVISFADQYGSALTTLDISYASQITIHADNADVADDLILSYRIKVHPDDDAFVEAATTTTQESTDEILAPYVIGHKLLGGVQLQVWWSNETGTSTGAKVSVSIK